MQTLTISANMLHLPESAFKASEQFPASFEPLSNYGFLWIFTVFFWAFYGFFWVFGFEIWAQEGLEKGSKGVRKVIYQSFRAITVVPCQNTVA